MRRILVDHARSQNAVKRNGGQRVELRENTAFSHDEQIDLVALDRALTLLAQLDPRQSRIVEMRFFGGLTEEEIAQELGLSSRTVKREWKSARAMLYGELRG
jgi:RNA polymerase sigma factor (TIGR02999 family)